mgnify:CR=1 FL=1
MVYCVLQLVKKSSKTLDSYGVGSDILMETLGASVEPAVRLMFEESDRKHGADQTQQT